MRKRFKARAISAIAGALGFSAVLLGCAPGRSGERPQYDVGKAGTNANAGGGAAAGGASNGGASANGGAPVVGSGGAPMAGGGGSSVGGDPPIEDAIPLEEVQRAYIELRFGMF